MSLITITSDWSKNDYYLPVLKGRLLSLCGAVQIVDISNTIRAFDVFEACFVLKHSYKSFPKGTVHIIAVGASLPSDGTIAVVKAFGHYFIGTDDGRFSLLFDNLKDIEAYRVKVDKNSSSLTDIEMYCAGVESVIFNTGLEPATLGTAGAEHAVVMIDKIVGRIIYIDSYGNAITNISKEDFLRVFDMVSESGNADGENIPDFTIYVGGPHLKFHEIQESYNSVEPGNEVVFFNSLDLLEMAVNRGNFAEAEGVDRTTEVLVKFK